MKPPSLYIHYTGAFLAFTFGLIYAWGQTMFSWVIIDSQLFELP